MIKIETSRHCHLFLTKISYQKSWISIQNQFQFLTEKMPFYQCNLDEKCSFLMCRIMSLHDKLLNLVQHGNFCVVSTNIPFSSSSYIYTFQTYHTTFIIHLCNETLGEKVEKDEMSLIPFTTQTYESNTSTVN